MKILDDVELEKLVSGEQQVSLPDIPPRKHEDESVEIRNYSSQLLKELEEEGIINKQQARRIKERARKRTISLMSGGYDQSSQEVYEDLIDKN